MDNGYGLGGRCGYGRATNEFDHEMDDHGSPT